MAHEHLQSKLPLGAGVGKHNEAADEEGSESEEDSDGEGEADDGEDEDAAAVNAVMSTEQTAMDKRLTELYLEERKEHLCALNFGGHAKKMEGEGIKDIFFYKLNKGIHVKRLMGDADSAPIHLIRNELSRPEFGLTEAQVELLVPEPLFCGNHHGIAVKCVPHSRSEA